ncbi:hypothetical protein [Streptomyces sp. KL116D]|uniref:hypothetical protein n=1 Tax=Streptomyces sp. KL116D TaxID=3045152 RepID=UPI003555C646
MAIWSDAHGLSTGGTVGHALEQELASLAFDMCFAPGGYSATLDDELVEDIWLEGFDAGLPQIQRPP